VTLNSCRAQSARGIGGKSNETQGKVKAMATDYATDPFIIIRATLSELAKSALYLETESDCAPAKPCPDYCAHLRATIRAIEEARTFAELGRVEWIAGQAALAIDAGV
jgi:hypothetical protein